MLAYNKDAAKRPFVKIYFTSYSPRIMICAHETIEETVVSILRAGNMGGSALRAELEKRGRPVSSQAVYDALRKLIRQEVVLKKGTRYELNYVWLKRLSQFAQPQGSSLFMLQDLLEGDSVVYYFQHLNAAGAFWMHTHQILLDQLEPGQIAVLYSANEWTSVIREPQDNEWAQTAACSDKLSLFAIGNANAHNKEYKSKHEDGNLNISVGNTYGFPVGYYLNVFNDYIVELIVPVSIEKRITKLFQETRHAAELRKQLVNIDTERSKIKLVVKRNQKQAKRLFKKIVRDFYIPKSFTSTHL